MMIQIEEWYMEGKKYYTIEYNGKIYTAMKSNMSCRACAFISNVSPSGYFTGAIYCKLPNKLRTKELMCPLQVAFPNEHRVFMEVKGGV